MLIHAFFVVFVAKTAQKLQCSILMKHANRGMGDAIEHAGLHRRVVYHVLENDFFAHLQRMIKLPSRHKVATQTAVAAKAVGVLHCTLALLRRVYV